MLNRLHRTATAALFGLTCVAWAILPALDAVPSRLVAAAFAAEAAQGAPAHEGTQEAAAPHGDRTATESRQGDPAKTGHASEPGEAAGHEASIWATVARVINFAIMAGVLVYFARSPFMQYLVTRGTDIRRGLAEAAAAREAAARQTAEIDRRLRALPGEIDALRTRGVEEIAAEEARIRKATEAERERLLVQARREIDLRLRMAERELTKHAADLAIGVASERIRRSIRDDDQARLVDRYLAHLGG